MRRRAALTGVLLGMMVITTLSPAIAEMGTLGGRAAPPDAVRSLADCSTKTGRLAVVLLIDESGSLRRTDQTNRRVEAIQAALHGLASAADRSAETDVPLSIDVTMLGFGVNATELVGWTPLNGATLPDLRRTSEQFARRNREIDTDYAAALLAAQASIAKSATPAESCSAILWFTDGEYDIEPRSTGEVKPYAPSIELRNAASAAALEDAGKELLCKDGGVVDAIRSTGTEILAVALSPTMAPPDQDFLRAVAEGTGGSARCGAVRSPGMPATGAFLGTEDVSQLTARFFELVNALAGGTQLPGAAALPVCAREACASGAHLFHVDPGIQSFNLLAVTSARGIDVELRSAEGTDVLAVAPSQSVGQAPLGSASTAWTWVADDAVLVEVTLPGDEGPWNGQWSVTFVDRTGASPGAVADAEIFVFGDIEPYLKPVEFRAGETNEFFVGAQHREGTPINEELFADVALEAVIVNPADGTREPIQLGVPTSAGLRSGRWKAPAPDFPAVLNVSITARITTISGQALAPVTRTSAVKVLPPSSYPTIEPAVLRYDAITGTDPGVAVLKVVGGDASGGCVWLDVQELRQAPDEAGELVINVDPKSDSKQSCLHVDAGEARELRVSINPSSAANGVMSGVLGIALISDTNPDVLRTSVNWSAPLQKPLDTAKAVKLSIALLAGGLLLPLLLMWLLNWLTAKFGAPSELMAARLKVMVTSTGAVFRTDQTQRSLAVEPSDFKAIDGSRKTRSFDVGDLHFQSRVALSPFSAPSGEVVASGGQAVASLPPPATGRSTDRTPVSFGLAGTALVVLPHATLDGLLGQRSRDPQVAGVLGNERPGSTRPDVPILLVLFAPAVELRKYAAHFDSHRGAVVAAVTALLELRTTELVAAATQVEGRQDASSPAGPTADTMPPPPPPGWRSATKSVPPPSPSTRSTGLSDELPPPRGGAESTPPAAPETQRSSNDGDTFGPPPGRLK